jgi:hypothetical protein
VVAALHDDNGLIVACADNGIDEPVFLGDAAGP